MKHLPKHLRPRWRYLGVEIEAWPDAEIGRRGFQRALWAAARSLLGDPGSADADLTVVRFRFANGGGEAIVRARRDEVEAARAALACVATVGGHPAGLRVRGTSGTIRACERKHLGHAPAGETGARGGPAGNERLDVRAGDGFVGATILDGDDPTATGDAPTGDGEAGSGG
jgi:ribonuclease P/MRP protein subunit POP5